MISMSNCRGSVIAIIVVILGVTLGFNISIAPAKPRQQGTAGAWSSCAADPMLCTGVVCQDEFGNGYCCASKDSDQKDCILVTQPANQPQRGTTVPPRPKGSTVPKAPVQPPVAR